MADTETLSKSYIELQSDELKTLITLESWGASLFLGSIALVVKQLVEWCNAPDPASCKVVFCLSDAALFVPAMIGLTGFLYLRIVNYGIRGVRTRLYLLLRTPTEAYQGSAGLTGWAMALMPMVFGVACTWLLAASRSTATHGVECFVVLAAVMFVAAVVIFNIQNSHIRAEYSKKMKEAKDAPAAVQ